MRPMVLLFVALFNSILGLSVLFPILAPLGRDLGLDELEVTSLTTAYALMQLVMSSFWGRRSDARGRKPILLVGICGFAVSFYAFAGIAQVGMAGALGHWPLLGLLMLTRVVGGIFSSATIPTAQAYAADVSERKDRTSAMAVIGAAFGLGVVFGPAIGAGISHLTGNLLAPVYFSASVAVVNAFFVAIKLPEPERHVDASAEREPTALAGVAKMVWPLLAVGLTATMASVAMEQTVAFYFGDRLGLSEQDTPGPVGLALAGYGVVAVISQGFVVRRFKLSPITLLRIGLPTAFAGFVLFIFAHDFATLTTALLLQGFGQGLILPGVTAGVSLGVSDETQGAVAGVNGATQGLARTIGPVLGGALYRYRHEAPYAFSACLLLLVMLVILVRPSVAPKPAPVAAEDPPSQ
ncbi:MAG TPA: MFS transporter [Sandaracinaceae bacterium LLY-WYZ-13_1]|nr:MFS transporter [Sandaracinaceae bacterium LLY-WYZ-13_1]